MKTSFILASTRKMCDEQLLGQIIPIFSLLFKFDPFAVRQYQFTPFAAMKMKIQTNFKCKGWPQFMIIWKEFDEMV
jgi:hypothetical protein